MKRMRRNNRREDDRAWPEAWTAGGWIPADALCLQARRTRPAGELSMVGLRRLPFPFFTQPAAYESAAVFTWATAQLAVLFRLLTARWDAA